MDDLEIAPAGAARRQARIVESVLWMPTSGRSLPIAAAIGARLSALRIPRRSSPMAAPIWVALAGALGRRSSRALAPPLVVHEA
jgi:hypothetical protein